MVRGEQVFVKDTLEEVEAAGKLEDIVNDMSDREVSSVDEADLTPTPRRYTVEYTKLKNQFKLEMTYLRSLIPTDNASKTDETLEHLTSYFDQGIASIVSQEQHMETLENRLKTLQEHLQTPNQVVDYNTGDLSTNEPDLKTTTPVEPSQAHDPALLTEDMNFLADLVAVIAASAVFGAIATSLSIPIGIGIIVGGIVVGPSCLGLVNQMDQIDTLAQVGTALILFGQGLEFNGEQVFKTKNRSLWAFTVQILGNGSVFAVLSSVSGISEAIPEIVLLSLSASLTSSAVAVNLSSEHNLLRGTHSQLLSSILVGQDLMMGLFLCLPEAFLMGSWGVLVLLRQIMYAVILVSLFIYISMTVMPRVTVFMLREEVPQLHLLSCLSMCLGAAYISLSLDLSGEFGAFFAGLALSTSKFDTDTVKRIESTKNLFSALLFVSIGMLISPHFLLTHMPSILIVFFWIMCVKFISCFITLKILKTNSPTALMAALAVSQIAEFSMILAGKGYSFGLIERGNYLLFLSAAVLSLIVNPLVFKATVSSNYVQLNQVGKVISVHESGKSPVNTI